MKYCLHILLLAAVVLLPQFAMATHVTLPDGISPLQATWLWGYHSVPAAITNSGTPYWYAYPHTRAERINNPVWSEVATSHIKADTKAPAILVMHGCSGIAHGSLEYRRYFAAAGYVVFEPDSFARPGRKPPCKRNVLHLRIEEIGQALAEIRKLPWVHQDRVILMGISEGGAAVAGWDKPGFAGHIIMEAACHDTKDRRPAAPLTTPVLALIGENDQNGKHCQISRDVAGSKSIVIQGAGHAIDDLPETGAAIISFLRTIPGRTPH
jgi:dienelactone hydrolase